MMLMDLIEPLNSLDGLTMGSVFIVGLVIGLFYLPRFNLRIGFIYHSLIIVTVMAITVVSNITISRADHLSEAEHIVIYSIIYFIGIFVGHGIYQSRDKEGLHEDDNPRC